MNSGGQSFILGGSVLDEKSYGRKEIGEYLGRCRSLKISPVFEVLLFLKDEGEKTLGLGKRVEKLTDSDVSAICSVLQKSRKLEELTLSDTLIGEKGVRAICGLVQNNYYLRSLDLSRNVRIGAKECNILTSYILQTPKLKTLKLDGCKIGDRAMEGFCSLIKQNLLEHLSLSNTKITDQGFVKFVALLRTNLSLKTLNVSHNDLTDKISKALGISLSLNRTLVEINLKCNRICETGCGLIANGISKSKNLKNLNLNYNFIKDKGAIQLANALSFNQSALEELSVGFNQIGVQGIRALIAMWKKNKTLKKLNIRGLPFTVPLLENLNTALIKGDGSPKRIFLDVDDRNTSEVTAVLDEIFKKNNNIENVFVGLDEEDTPTRQGNVLSTEKILYKPFVSGEVLVPQIETKRKLEGFNERIRELQEKVNEQEDHLKREREKKVTLESDNTDKDEIIRSQRVNIQLNEQQREDLKRSLGKEKQLMYDLQKRNDALQKSINENQRLRSALESAHSKGVENNGMIENLQRELLVMKHGKDGDKFENARLLKEMKMALREKELSSKREKEKDLLKINELQAFLGKVRKEMERSKKEVSGAQKIEVKNDKDFSGLTNRINKDQEKIGVLESALVLEKNKTQSINHDFRNFREQTNDRVARLEQRIEVMKEEKKGIIKQVNSAVNGNYDRVKSFVKQIPGVSSLEIKGMVDEALEKRKASEIDFESVSKLVEPQKRKIQKVEEGMMKLMKKVDGLGQQVQKDDDSTLKELEEKFNRKFKNNQGQIYEVLKKMENKMSSGGLSKDDYGRLEGKVLGSINKQNEVIQNLKTSWVDRNKKNFTKEESDDEDYDIVTDKWLRRKNKEAPRHARVDFKDDLHQIETKIEREMSKLLQNQETHLKKINHSLHSNQRKNFSRFGDIENNIISLSTRVSQFNKPSQEKDMYGSKYYSSHVSKKPKKKKNDFSKFEDANYSEYLTPKTRKLVKSKNRMGRSMNPRVSFRNVSQRKGSKKLNLIGRKLRSIGERVGNLETFFKQDQQTSIDAIKKIL